jgi:hypothetical protein
MASCLEEVVRCRLLKDLGRYIVLSLAYVPKV